MLQKKFPDSLPYIIQQKLYIYTHFNASSLKFSSKSQSSSPLTFTLKYLIYIPLLQTLTCHIHTHVTNISCPRRCEWWWWWWHHSVCEGKLAFLHTAALHVVRKDQEYGKWSAWQQESGALARVCCLCTPFDINVYRQSSVCKKTKKKQMDENIYICARMRARIHAYSACLMWFFKMNCMHKAINTISFKIRKKRLKCRGADCAPNPSRYEGVNVVVRSWGFSRGGGDPCTSLSEWVCMDGVGFSPPNRAASSPPLGFTVTYASSSSSSSSSCSSSFSGLKGEREHTSQE